MRGKARTAMIVVLFTAVIAAGALTVIFWSGEAGETSPTVSPSAAFSKSTSGASETASATPAPTENPQVVEKAQKRLRASAEALADTVADMGEMEINATLLSISGLQNEMDSLLTGCEKLVDMLDSLIREIDDLEAHDDGGVLSSTAESLELSDVALSNEIEELKHAKQQRDLTAIRQGLIRLTELVNEACISASNAIDTVSGE